MVPALYYAHLVALRARYHLTSRASTRFSDHLADSDSQSDIGTNDHYLATHDIKEELVDTMYFM